MYSRLCECCGEPVTQHFIAQKRDTRLCRQCDFAQPAAQAIPEHLEMFTWIDSAGAENSIRASWARLHARYAPSPRAFELVWTHSLIVAEIAEQLRTASCLDLDAGSVLEAALAHDLGVYRCLDWVNRFQVEMSSTSRHGLVGGMILRYEKYGEQWIRAAETHIGVGISRDDILQRGINLPARDFVPENELEWLIAYADKFHSKHSTFVRFEEALKYQRQISAKNARRMCELRARFGEPELSGLCKRYEPWHTHFGDTSKL